MLNRNGTQCSKHLCKLSTPSSLLKARFSRACSLRLSPVRFAFFFRNRDFTGSLTIPLLDTWSIFSFQKYFFISIFVHCLPSYHWVWIVRRSTFMCPLGYLSLLIWSLWVVSSSYWAVPDLLGSPWDKPLISEPSVALCLTYSAMNIGGFFVLLTLALDTELQMCLTSAQKRGRIPLPDLPGISFQFNLDCCWSSLLQGCIAGPWSACCLPQILFCKVLFQLVRPKALQLHRATPP